MVPEKMQKVLNKPMFKINEADVGHENRIWYTSLMIGWPFWVTRCQWFLYGYKISFLGDRRSPTLKHFLKAVTSSVTGHRLYLFLMLFKCFQWPVWAVSSSLPVLTVVRATINTSQLLGNNDKYGSIAIYRISDIKKRCIWMRIVVPEKDAISSQ